MFLWKNHFFTQTICFRFFFWFLKHQSLFITWRYRGRVCDLFKKKNRLTFDLFVLFLFFIFISESRTLSSDIISETTSCAWANGSDGRRNANSFYSFARGRRPERTTEQWNERERVFVVLALWPTSVTYNRNVLRRRAVSRLRRYRKNDYRNAFPLYYRRRCVRLKYVFNVWSIYEFTVLTKRVYCFSKWTKGPILFLTLAVYNVVIVFTAENYRRGHFITDNVFGISTHYYPCANVIVLRLVNLFIFF